MLFQKKIKAYSSLAVTMLLVVCFISLGSCQKRLEVGEYINWCKNPENGLQDKISKGSYNFVLDYQPQELVAIKPYSDLEELKESKTFDDEVKEHLKYQYFNLKISSQEESNFLKNNIKDEQEYFQRLAYFSSFAQPDFLLVEGNDTLTCVMYHFERNFGIQPFHNILLGFSNSQEDEQDSDKELIFKDRALGLDLVKLKIKEKSFKNIPKLIL